MIRILLVDDQNIVRQGIQALLEPRPKLKVVGTAQDGNSAIEQVGILMPDIVLMDLEMPGISGITAIQKICQQFPKTKVLVLSSHEGQEYVTQALQAGASGYLLKNTLAEELEEAIWSLDRGHCQIESKLLEKALAKKSISQSIKSIEPRESNVVEEQFLQETSCRLQSNTNNKQTNKVGESTENSQNGSLSTKTSEINVKPVSERSKIKIEKPPDVSKETLNFKKSLNKQASKKPLIQQDSIEREQKPQQKKEISSKLLGYRIWGLVVISILLIMGITLHRFWNRPKPLSSYASKPIRAELPEIKKVAALGRIEPEAKVIKLSAPLALDGDRLAKLLVEEGDYVKAGQIIAILDSRKRLKDAVQQAQEQVRVSEAKFAQVQAGAKLGEIQAQREQISRLEAELSGEIKTQNAAVARLQAQANNARSEYNRHQQLYTEGAIAISTIDSKRLALETAQEQLNEAQATQDRINSTLKAQLAEAKANLDRISEVRPVDVHAAQTEVNSAISALNKAKTDLAQAYVRAPIDSQILTIQTRSGEKIGEEGIAELAQTDSMIAIAEVYQSDIAKVKLGQSAEITGQAFDGIVRGKVYQVGLQVSRQNVFSNQPGENLDRRVVEVKIRLNPEDNKRVAGLTNLQVQTAIYNQLGANGQALK